ncbi:MAG TPA: hypothetical protein VF723_01060 [Pyrinomonadaceae bacterium]|jgi:hypothetical protein
MSANVTGRPTRIVALAAQDVAPQIEEQQEQPLLPGAPRKIVNAQTVCNVKNEKGKLCNGHLKQTHTGGEAAEAHLRGDDVLFKCQSCGTLYMGPPLGHVRDPAKQQRFVERELTALLQAAGGTLPVIRKNEKGVFVLEEAPAHAPAPAAKAAAQAGAAPAAKAATPGNETAEEKKARLDAEAEALKALNAQLGPIPGAAGPAPGETPAEKIARLQAVAAEAKRRKEMVSSGAFKLAAAGAASAPRTSPTAATTSGTDSSAQADEHRPEAEAQAATGMASAVPLSSAAATASPAAGAPVAKAAARRAVPGAPLKRADFDTGPVPGETQEQKIARLRAVVAAAKERAGTEG